MLVWGVLKPKSGQAGARLGPTNEQTLWYQVADPCSQQEHEVFDDFNVFRLTVREYVWNFQLWVPKVMMGEHPVSGRASSKNAIRTLHPYSVGPEEAHRIRMQSTECLLRRPFRRRGVPPSWPWTPTAENPKRTPQPYSAGHVVQHLES